MTWGPVTLICLLFGPEGDFLDNELELPAPERRNLEDIAKVVMGTGGVLCNCEREISL